MNIKYTEHGNLILTDDNGNEKEYIPRERLEKDIEESVSYSQKKRSRNIVINAVVVIAAIIIIILK